MQLIPAVQQCYQVIAIAYKPQVAVSENDNNADLMHHSPVSEAETVENYFTAFREYCI